MALRRNILIFHQGALGDFVLTWPIVLALARIHPQSRVFYVTHEQKGRLAEKILGIEWADAEAGWHPLYGAGGPLPERAGKLLEGAHSIVSFLSAPADPWVANVRQLAPEAKVLTIDPSPPESYAGHATQYQLEQLRPWPAAHSAAEQIHRSIQTRGIAVARPGQMSGVVIHPGSGASRKNWPMERYLELIRRLRDAGQDVRILIGEVEQERWPADVLTQVQQVAEIRRPQTYLDLMAELLSARAFLGNDSGPGHLAAILGVPVLALFGPTNAAQWKPIGPHVRVLRSDPLDAMSVDAVYESLAAL